MILLTFAKMYLIICLGENNLIEEQSEIVNLDPGQVEGAPQGGDGSGPVSVMIIGNNNVFEVSRY